MADLVSFVNRLQTVFRSGLLLSSQLRTMSGHEQFDMDSMDEQDGSGSNSPEPAGPAIGLSTESGVSPEDRRTKATANADIELSRRAVPVIEVDEDVCSVCLDSFTQEDPGNRTGCGYAVIPV